MPILRPVRIFVDSEVTLPIYTAHKWMRYYHCYVKQTRIDVDKLSKYRIYLSTG